MGGTKQIKKDLFIAFKLRSCETPPMNARQAIKAIVDECSDQELIAMFAAMAHPDREAIGTFFSRLSTDLAKRIETKVGQVDKD